VVKGRRLFLGALGGALGSLVLERTASATLSRGLSLRELVRSSGHAVVATPLESTSQWVTIGGQRQIVTDTRVRIDEVLALDAPAENELWIRVLGGVVGKLGQRVEGQAELVLSKPSALFLWPTSPVLAYVTGSAQGHYPLKADTRSIWRLQPSPGLPELVERERSAVSTLSGTTLPEARELVRAAIR
jgi:hypothetical protein